MSCKIWKTFTPVDIEQRNYDVQVTNTSNVTIICPRICYNQNQQDLHLQFKVDFYKYIFPLKVMELYFICPYKVNLIQNLSCPE